MRWPRAGIVVAVVGLVLLGAGWWLASIGSAGPVRARAHSGSPVAPNAALSQQLRQYLARNSSPAQPVRPRTLQAPSAHGSMCFVAAGGFCSIRPCVVPVASAARPACGAAAAPLRAVPVRRP